MIRLSACCRRRAGARACYVLAHGAGAGMTHPFMAAVADGLAERGIATLRYQFPYMERGSKRPDPPAVAHATVRAAVAEAARRAARAAALRRRQVVRRPHDLAGAGRGAAAGRARPRVPRLSAASGRASPSTSAREHLADVHVPMLFLQGTRDALAELDAAASRWSSGSARARRCSCSTMPTIRSTCRRAAAARTPRCAREMLDALARWIEPLAATRTRRG